MRSLHILPFLLALTFTINAQQVNTARLDSLFDHIDHHHKGMGSLSLYYDGKEIYSRAIGLADVERKTRNTTQTKFRIGSITKTFTAVMVMQLIEEGKLTVDTKLDKFFPEVPNASLITIEMMLRHRTGLYNITAAPDFYEWQAIKHSNEDLLRRIIKDSPIAEPGKYFQYCNSNYILLGFIIENLDNRSYAKSLEQRICKPLKLKNTYVGGRISSERGEARSYTSGNRWAPATEADMSVPGAAGSISSTASDVNRFYSSLLGGKLVSARSLGQMKTLIGNMGMGLVTFPFDGRKAFGHTGGIDGFNSIAAHFESEKLTVTYLSNGAGMVINDLLIGVLSIYFNRPYTFPVFEKTFSVTENDLLKYPGTYSGSSFPLKLTITREGNALKAQGSGQPSFFLEAIGPTTFKYDAAKLRIEFNSDSTMILSQGVMKYELKRE